MRALKVLLAIQDSVVRHSVKSFLHGNQLNIDTIAEVTSAADVIGLLMQTHIDIVIVDMQMTVKPDASFFRSIRLYNADAACIVIGSAQDFTIVKSSDEVFQYLLKPLNLELLLLSLQRCTQWLEQTETYAQSFTFVQEQLQRARTISIQNLALDLFHGAVTPTQNGIDKRLADLGISFSFPFFYCVSGDIISPHSPNVNHNLWFGAIRERIRENFPYVSNGQELIETLTALDGNRIALIVGCQQESYVNTSHAMVHAAFSVLKKAFGLDYILTFSSTTDTLLSIPVLYQQSRSACQYYRFVQQCGVYLVTDDVQLGPSRYFVSQKWKSELLSNITDRLPQKIYDTLKKIRQDLMVASQNRMEYLSLSISDLMLVGVSLLETRGIAIEPLYSMDCFTQHFFESFQDIHALFEWLNTYFHTIYNAYHAASGVKSGDSVVGRIKNFTQEHYAEPLTLKSIGTALHYSANYLGRVFYNSEHVRYSVYLHQVRIEEAAKLLATTELAPSYIAEQVGYRDVSYFHQIFRQIMGVTPKAYRSGIPPQL